MDDDVGVVFIGLCRAVVHLRRTGQPVVQVGGRIAGVISEISRVVATAAQRPGDLPLICWFCWYVIWILVVVFRHALGIHHAAGLAAAIDFVDVGSILEIDLSIFIPRA